MERVLAECARTVAAQYVEPVPTNFYLDAVRRTAVLRDQAHGEALAWHFLIFRPLDLLGKERTPTWE